MIRRPPRSTLDRSSAASDVYKRQLFVCPGTNVENKISSMPGNSQLSVDLLVKKGKELFDKGVQSILIFGIPETKDEHGLVALSLIHISEPTRPY